MGRAFDGRERRRERAGLVLELQRALGTFERCSRQSQPHGDNVRGVEAG